MSIVDLQNRIVDNQIEYQRNWQSPGSKIFVSPIPHPNPTSMDLEVGNSYIIPGSSQSFLISESDGLQIEPKQTVIILTKQRFKLPLNVFGLVTGKGRFIYKGCFVSSGKIDPGFDGQLKIGFYNGGTSAVKLNSGDTFATAYFINTEITLEAPLEQYNNNLDPDLKEIRLHQRLWLYIKAHWISIILWTIAFIPAALYYATEFLKTIGLWS